MPVRFTVAWEGLDNLSGVRDYDVDVSTDGVNWHPWLTGVTETQAERIGTPGDSYHFRVQARDNVDNTSAWVEVGPVEIKAVTKYYTFGGSKVAMRQGDEVYYLHGDHLGSTSLTTDENGVVVSEVRYHPYGQERWTSKTPSPTDFGFTSQRLERGFGLMDYNARYYSPVLGRFVSPDTIVPEPGSSGGFNRYRYTRNNPLKYTDPSGHIECEGIAGCVEPPAPPSPGSDAAWDRAISYDNTLTYGAFSDGRAYYESYGADSSTYLGDLNSDSELVDYKIVAATVYAEYGLGTDLNHGVLGVHEDMTAQIIASQGSPIDVLADIGGLGFNGGPAAAGIFKGGKGGGNIPSYDRSAFGDWKPGVQQSVLERDNYTCSYGYCGGQRGGDLTVDHVTSLREAWNDGAHAWSDKQRNDWFNDTDNLVTACRSCNSKKQASTILNFFLRNKE